MKEMNRREFLTLSGAAVVALSLAGCGGGPSAPTPPPMTSESSRHWTPSISYAGTMV